MRRRIVTPLAIVLLTLLACSPYAQAATRDRSPFGVMAGLVTDPSGTPQMGAAIALISVDGRTVRQVFTDDQGAFVLERVIPGLYSLRVTLASFLPVQKENVLIQPGVHSFLSINLNTLFTSLDLLRNRRTVEETDDDWTWVLRSVGSNRPLFHYKSDAGDHTTQARAAGPNTNTLSPSVLQFSGGAGRSSSFGSEADFNTSFAVANQLFSNTSLLLSGNLGYERRTPATAFRGVLRRELPNSRPEVSVTLRQIFLPGAFWANGPARDETMQSLTVSAGNRVRLSNSFRLEYGFIYDSISYLRRLNSFSPYGRLVYEPSAASSLQFAYTEGAPRMQLPGGGPLSDAASELAVFPRLSIRDNTPTVQRGRHVEAAYTRKVGERTKALVGGYHDDLSNLAITSVNHGLPPLSDDFFPDVFSQNYSFNGGSFSSSGVRAAVEHKFNEKLDATVAYSYGGMLALERGFLFTNSPEELRSILKMQRRHAITAKLGADIPVTHTHVFASYKWILGTALTAGDIYDETLAQAEPNLNIVIRQPLPSIVVLPGRVEAVADFRNLLAQGYVPVTTADGKRLLLVQNVRSFRGGFAFRF